MQNGKSLRLYGTHRGKEIQAGRGTEDVRFSRPRPRPSLPGSASPRPSEHPRPARRRHVGQLSSMAEAPSSRSDATRVHSSLRGTRPLPSPSSSIPPAHHERPPRSPTASGLPRASGTPAAPTTSSQPRATASNADGAHTRPTHTSPAPRRGLPAGARAWVVRLRARMRKTGNAPSATVFFQSSWAHALREARPRPRVVLPTEAPARLRSSWTRAFLSSLFFFELIGRARFELQNGGLRCVGPCSLSRLLLNGRLTSPHCSTQRNESPPTPKDMLFETQGLPITESFEALSTPETTARRFRPECRGRDLAPARRCAPRLRRARNPARAAAATGEVRGGPTGRHGRGGRRV